RDAGAPPASGGAPADAFGGRDGGVAAALEHRAEYQVVHRRQSGIGFCDRVLVELRTPIAHHLSFLARRPPRRKRRPVPRQPCAVTASPAVGSRYPPVATLCMCPTNWRALVCHERLKANPRQASREIRRAPGQASRRSSLTTPLGAPPMPSFRPLPRQPSSQP